MRQASSRTRGGSVKGLVGEELMISIVLPAHNESEYLGEAVRGVVNGMRQRPRSFEVLIVENGSTDGTEAAAR